MDDPDPILTLLGTLSILFNRIKFKNFLNQMIQTSKLQIMMEDKYFDEWVFERFKFRLKLFSDIVTDESDDDRVLSIISLSFNQFMNIYLE